MLRVGTVQRVAVEKHCYRIVERDSVFRRVGFSRPRVPLEHLFSIYEMSGRGGRSGDTSRGQKEASGFFPTPPIGLHQRQDLEPRAAFPTPKGGFNNGPRATVPGASTIRLGRFAPSLMAGHASRSDQGPVHERTLAPQSNGALSDSERAAKRRVEEESKGIPFQATDQPSASVVLGPVLLFVYILKCADDSLYVGSTTDVDSRVQR